MLLSPLVNRLPQPYRFNVYFWLIGVRNWIGRLIRRKAACGNCDHFFDPADERAFVAPLNEHYRDPRYRGLNSICPACNQMSDGSMAWAVKNDCNGVFTDMIFDRKIDAEKKAAEFTDSEYVVPVRVIVEPEDEWWRRDYHEREMTEYASVAESADATVSEAVG